VRTVERHIAHIYGKTGSNGRAAATRYAVRHGLI
jgi:DNA-binding CsgD family transcriptional regulator